MKFRLCLFWLMFLCATVASYKSNAQYSCASALIIEGTGVHFGNTTGVDNDGLTGTLCAYSVDYSGQVWYRFTPVANGDLELSTDGDFTAWDTKLHVFSGFCGNLICEGSNDDFFGLQSYVSIPVTAGITYFVRVSGYDYASGSYRLEVNFIPSGDFSYGCKDEAACNYNAGADFEDGSCCYANCKGIIVTAGIYPGEVDWELFEGNNVLVGAGGAPSSNTACLSSCEYSLAMFDSYGDGWNGATWSILNTQGQSEVTATMQAGDGPVVDEFLLASVCAGIPSGCTNPFACNYDAAAQVDDGSCCYGECEHIYVTRGSWPTEVGWIVSGAESGVIASVNAPFGAPYAGNICVTNPSCDYTVTMTDTFGDGWNNATYTIATEDGTVESTGTLTSGFQGTSAVFNMGDPVYGCNNPQASNYNPFANCTNFSSCVYCGGGSSAYNISIDINEVMTDLPLIVAIYNQYGLEVFYDDFTPAFDQDYFATVCLSPGCYFINLEYGIINSSAFAPGGTPVQQNGGRGAVFSEVDWTISSAGGVLWASGNALGAFGFSVNTFSCPLPFEPLQATAVSTTCNGSIEAITIVGMPNAQLLIHDFNYNSYDDFYLDGNGNGVYYTNPIYGLATFDISYNPVPQEWFNPSYAYPTVYIQGVEPPTASIVGNGEAICEGEEVIITLQGTPNSEAAYSIWAVDLDLIYQIFSGSLNFDNFGYAYVSTGPANQSLEYNLESVAIGNCINSDVFDSFNVTVQDPVITEYDLSTTSNVFCVGDVIETSVDFGYPENPWNPNNPQGGTPGSNYSWYLIADNGTLNASYNSTAYSNQVSINLGTTTPGNYRLAVYEYTSAGCYSPVIEFPFEVRELVYPSFNTIGPYCVGEEPNPLPANSLQNISGTWSPLVVTTDYPFINDYYQGFSYSFNPDSGQCAAPVSVEVTIIEYPDFEVGVSGPISFCEGGSVVLYAPDAQSNVWYSYAPGTTTAGSQSIIATQASTYYVRSENSFAGYTCVTISEEVVVMVTPATTLYADADNDGFGNPNVTVESCDPVPGYVANESDCNDSNAAINPNATEVCDGVDNDCDFFIDELPANAILDCDNNCINDSNNNGVCDENEQIGCTDPTACNYDANATTDNGLCIEAGCNVPGACNYNPDAGCSDGSCEFPGCTNSQACNYDSTAGCDDESCEYPGCTNDEACNFSASAGCDDGSCEFPGCTNAQACNYDSTAGCDDESCEYPGCTDGEACNYSASAGCDDGSCEFSGCTNDDACNFDPLAGCDNGSCEFPGCNDALALNYDPLAGCSDNSCVYEGVGGCTDAAACNFDAGADFDDGSCQYPQAYLDCNGNCLNDGNSNGICDEQEGCTDPAACNYDATALGDDGSCEYPLVNLDCAGNCLNDADNDGICNEDEVPGCTIESACNFNAAATEENGSCTFAAVGYDCAGNCIVDTNNNGICDPEEGLGCMNETACNYDPNANVDNGTCLFPEFGYDCLGNCTLDSDSDGVCDFDELPGCTDADACNYNPLATDENGSCQYPQLFLNCDGTCIHDVDGDAVCDEFEIDGCTNADACNYTADATDDNGSCITQFALGQIVGPQTVQVDESVSYATAMLNNADYQWLFTPTAFCENPCDGDAISVLFNSAGDYSITVIAINELYPTCADTMSMNVTAEVEVPDYVGSLQATLPCAVYPNPVIAQAILEVASPDWLGARAELMDATGRLVWSTTITNYRTAIDMSLRSAGIYSLTLVAPLKGQHNTLRLIKP